MRHSILIVAVLAGLALGSGGGCHDPAAAKAAAVRQARIRHHLDRFAAHEADGSRRVRASFELADRVERRHADMLRHNVQWWRHDVQRWESEQSDYQRRIEAEFEGDQAASAAAFRAMFY
jgi:hypothetical protein